MKKVTQQVIHIPYNESSSIDFFTVFWFGSYFKYLFKCLKEKFGNFDKVWLHVPISMHPINCRFQLPTQAPTLRIMIICGYLNFICIDWVALATSSSCLISLSVSVQYPTPFLVTRYILQRFLQYLNVSYRPYISIYHSNINRSVLIDLHKHLFHVQYNQWQVNVTHHF